jgi:hypothetical protein
VLFTNRTLSDVAPIFTGCFTSATVEGSVQVFGGSMSALGNNFQNGSSLDGDVLVNQRIHYGAGEIFLRRVYFGQTNDTNSAVSNFSVYQSSETDNASAPRVWGPGGFAISNGMRVAIAVGTAAAGWLLTGATKIDNATTAWPWVSGSNAYGAAQTITAAAVDSTGGLSDPVSGSRFFIVH